MYRKTVISGQHRALGSNLSKVRSLKMDNKVWTEPLIQVRGAEPPIQVGDIENEWTSSVTRHVLYQENKPPLPVYLSMTSKQQQIKLECTELQTWWLIQLGLIWLWSQMNSSSFSYLLHMVTNWPIRFGLQLCQQWSNCYQIHLMKRGQSSSRINTAGGATDVSMFWPPHTLWWIRSDWLRLIQNYFSHS